MRTLLFTLSFLCTAGINAQTPLNNFYLPQDKISYFIATSPVPLAQNNSGANMAWDFSQLVSVGTAELLTTQPTNPELVIFPFSTAVTTTNRTIGNEIITDRIFSRTTGTSVSITGMQMAKIELMYDMDYATLGNFPLQYGFANSDGISGSYNLESGYSDSFNGNSTTSVDAYGTLTLNMGSVPVSTNVTRLKTTQNIILNYLSSAHSGTVTQTVYSYYRDNSPISAPVFRSTSTTINAPLLGINHSTEYFEVFESHTLGEQDVNMAIFEVTPNPFENELFIKNPTTEKVEKITINDITGKQVISFNHPENSLNLNQLQEGVYFAQIKTDSGTFTKKIVKK